MDEGASRLPSVRNSPVDASEPLIKHEGTTWVVSGEGDCTCAVYDLLRAFEQTSAGCVRQETEKIDILFGERRRRHGCIVRRSPGTVALTAAAGLAQPGAEPSLAARLFYAVRESDAVADLDGRHAPSDGDHLEPARLVQCGTRQGPLD